MSTCTDYDVPSSILGEVGYSVPDAVSLGAASLRGRPTVVLGGNGPPTCCLPWTTTLEVARSGVDETPKSPLLESPG